MAYLDLSRAVRGVDSILRQRCGIQEFTEDANCIFRVSLESSNWSVVLSDGVVVNEGDPVLELHFWNEHLPLIPGDGPSPGWAASMKRRVQHSLSSVATHLARTGEFDGIEAIHGAPPFGSRLGALQVARTANRFGFDVIDGDGPSEWRTRIHDVFDSMLLLGLAYAFNPGRLRSPILLRHRHQLWISRRKLEIFYGGSGFSDHVEGS